MAQALDHEDRELSWTGRAVDIDRIEAELTKLRHLTAGDPDGSKVAIRTSLVNMVVHAEDDDTAARASRVIEDLATHHPSRALVVIARPSEDESQIDASLAAHCHLAQGMEQQVCCEEVTLHVSGRAALHLHSIIVPLLIPDLPVVVWWTGPLPDKSHLIEELCDVADHFIVDSSRFADQLGDLARIRGLASLHDCAIGDLNYERVRSWRDLVERHTGAAGLGDWLSSVKSAEIRYTGLAQQTPAQAILFLAWLAVHCAWDLGSVSAQGSNRLTLRQDEREIPVYLEPVKYEGIDRGWLVSIKLAFERDGEAALLSVSRTGDPLHVTVRTELPDGVREDHVRIEACDSQTVLMRQLDTAPHDPEFVRLLIAAAPLIQATRA